jgi:hypothetical protein
MIACRHRHMAMGGHGLPKVSLWLSMPDPSMRSSIPLETARRTPLDIDCGQVLSRNQDVSDDIATLSSSPAALFPSR